MQLPKVLPCEGTNAPHWQQLLIEHGLFDEANSTFPDLNASPVDKTAKVSVIRDALALLTEPGQIVEMRVLGVNGKRRTDSGYFDDLEKLARAAATYEGRAEGIYFTVNPVNPALMSRASNRVKEYAEHTTSDADVLKRITLPIDFDSIRPAGISASKAEKHAALERAWMCRTWLKSQGWPDVPFADSGNGAHLLYAIDLPNNPDSAELVKRCLAALSYLFSDEQVKVDTSTSNASRIFKLYGTLARKGDNTPERPHRRAAIISAPTRREVVSREQLEALAAQVPTPARTTPIHVTSAKPSSHINYGKAALDREVSNVAAAQSGNRNNQLFKSAAALFSLVAANALNESEVWQVLLSAAQSIGLSEQEARRTIQSGADHGLSQPRIIPKTIPAQLPQSETLDIRQASPTAPPKSLSPQTPAAATSATPKSAAEMLMHVDDLDDLPPIRWLIQDYVPEDSLVEVYGAPSAGKTQIVFDMAQTLAAAGKTVIYVVAEGLRGYRSRKLAWQKFRKQEGGELYIWREPVQLFESSAVQQFIDAIKPKQPVLVVFDTLSRCSLGADENNQKDMGFILESLDRVRRDTGASVIAVHHTNAAGGRERGSTVIRGGMTVMMEVSKEDDLIAVSCAKVKDSAEFDTVFFKPILVDIGEEAPVPVLVPAEKRVQTKEDKLSSLQLEILRAVGMEMFTTSGIKSSQLDEILPPGTKRASKYYSLNNLIRLGYVAPHEKGDPYVITEAGRSKLSNAESASVSLKSNLSKASPSPFIWTLPASCPMSSPVPHTYGCGTDKTLDNKATEQTTNKTNSTEDVKEVTNAADIPVSNVQPEIVEPENSFDDLEVLPMTALDIACYARQIDVQYPTLDGADLYKIAEVVPRHLRNAFELALGDAFTPYWNEVLRRKQDPPEKEVRDMLALYLPMGFMSCDALYEGYQHACELNHKMPFLTALNTRNSKAILYLKEMVAGKKIREMVLVQAIPKYPNGDGGKG